MSIIDCLEYYSGLLTFLVTLIYAITTIFILRANKRAADAAFAQCEESKRQFEEENRPQIVVEFIFEKRLFYGLRFVNEGRRIANHVCIKIEHDFIDNIPPGNIRTWLKKQEGKECIIGAGQHYDLFIGTVEYRDALEKLPLSGTVSYENDGAKYEERFYIDVEAYMTFFSLDSDMENLLRKLDKQNTELNRIGNMLSTLNTLMQPKDKDEENHA